MRLKPTVSLLGLCLLATGCQLTADATHNLIFETCLATDEFCGMIRYRCMAWSAWREYKGAHPDCADSGDFGSGFRAGFASYLEGGGDPSPPVPPFRYWKLRSRTPEGREAANEWSVGFHEGVLTAKTSGLRDLIVVPLDKDDDPPPPPPGPGTPGPGPGARRPTPGPALTPPTEELPAPNPVRPQPPAPPPNVPLGGQGVLLPGVSGTAKRF